MASGDITASTINFPCNGANGVAYLASPAGNAKLPSVIVIHHMPGWDEWTFEVVRKFAHNGFAAMSPHLYFRMGTGSADDLAARARDAGGVSDDQVMGDVAATANYLRSLPNSNGKVGVIGFCSGGRQTYLAGGRLAEVDALVNCWGGSVIVDDPKQLNEKRPVAPIDYTKDIKAPMLGIFGNDDANPNKDQVNRIEAELKKHGKAYEFHRYDGAGHGFFAHYRPGYRPEQAADAWQKVLAFYRKNLA